MLVSSHRVESVANWFARDQSLFCELEKRGGRKTHWRFFKWFIIDLAERRFCSEWKWWSCQVRENIPAGELICAINLFPPSAVNSRLVSSALRKCCFPELLIINRPIGDGHRHLDRFFYFRNDFSCWLSSAERFLFLKTSDNLRRGRGKIRSECCFADRHFGCLK